MAKLGAVLEEGNGHRILVWNILFCQESQTTASYWVRLMHLSVKLLVANQNSLKKEKGDFSGNISTLGRNKSLQQCDA